MEKIELIKSAHEIDCRLRTLSAEIADDVLQKKIASIQEEWRELAYAISVHLSGVDASVGWAASRKRSKRKKVESPVDAVAPFESNSAGDPDNIKEATE